MANNGYGKAFLWVSQSCLLSATPPSAGKVFFCLVSHANPDGECWPGRRTICKETGAGTSTLTECITALRRVGLIKVFSNDAGAYSYSIAQCREDASDNATEFNKGTAPKLLRRPQRGKRT